MILSSAMCEMKEVVDAVNSVISEGLYEVAMLQCTGNYPTANQVLRAESSIGQATQGAYQGSPSTH